MRDSHNCFPVHRILHKLSLKDQEQHQTEQWKTESTKINHHLGIVKSTESSDKTAIHFYDSVMQQYGIGTFKNFGSVILDNIRGDKVVAFLNLFFEILAPKLITIGLATPN